MTEQTHPDMPDTRRVLEVRKVGVWLSGRKILHAVGFVINTCIAGTIVAVIAGTVGFFVTAVSALF